MRSYEESIRAAMEAARYPTKRERLVLHRVVCARLATQLRSAGKSERQVAEELADYEQQFKTLDEEFQTRSDFKSPLGFGDPAGETTGEQVANRTGRAAYNLIIILVTILLIGYLWNR